MKSCRLARKHLLRHMRRLKCERLRGVQACVARVWQALAVLRQQSLSRTVIPKVVNGVCTFVDGLPGAKGHRLQGLVGCMGVVDQDGAVQASQKRCKRASGSKVMLRQLRCSARGLPAMMLPCKVWCLVFKCCSG